jgi:hypothetical protein
MGSNVAVILRSQKRPERRLSPVTARSRDDLLSEPKAAAQPRPREPSFVLHTCRLHHTSGRVRLGGL